MANTRVIISPSEISETPRTMTSHKDQSLVEMAHSRMDEGLATHVRDTRPVLIKNRIADADQQVPANAFTQNEWSKGAGISRVWPFASASD